VCRTLVSTKSTPDENHSDSSAIQDALTACRGQGAVKLTSSGTNNVFVSGHLTVDSTILWVDAGTTLYASRDPQRYQSTGNCGLTGISDSSACLPLLSVTGDSAGIVGEGVIDGQGGEPLLGQDYSWWDLSNALRASNGSGPNPALVEVKKASAFVMYKITLHNSPKFHVKLSAAPASGTCSTPGSGFTVWGVTILTPSVTRTTTGFRPTPYYARNSDGIDPGEFALTSCGVIACSRISTGDDQVALKASHGLHDIVIAHNHFGTGHGMSLGSETSGGASNISIYDLTIDADSRWNGAPLSNTADFNGLRVKSDESRGGPVDHIVYQDVCMRDILNPIVIDSSYNPLYGGTAYPDFGSISMQRVRDVTCMGLTPPIVILQGFNEQHPAGPIQLDDVTIDGITPLDVAAQYASVVLGPGTVNFVPPANSGVEVTNNVSAPAMPKQCTFPPLPVPQ
jgi:polygalacturonase